MAFNGGYSYREQIGPSSAGRSVLEHLAASRRHSPAAIWSARIERGEVELDGAIAEPGWRLRPGQMLVWHRPPWDEPDVPTDIAWLHEDAALVGVNKPSGLPTMPAGGFLTATLLALVRARYPEASPLHRLGRHTSGIALFARTQDAAASLSRAWRAHAIGKRYRALAEGVATDDHLTIDVPIGPIAHPTLGTVHAACPGGKNAHSEARVLQRGVATTLFEVDITTGRPHQIRIHLAAAGHPLTGDPLYAAGGQLKPFPGLPGDGGYLLHAERLTFTHPESGAAMTLVAPPPAWPPC